MSRTTFLRLTFVGAAALLAAEANAQAGVKVGELRCDVGREVGLILGAREALQCRFSGIGGGSENYRGTITKLGIDVGVDEAGTLVWAVLAPASSVAPGALNGHYYGAGAEVTAGVGVGANVLVGGFDKSITLQPLSLQGNVGVGVAAGVEQLELKLD
jgi:hypothetical protein